MTERCDPGHLSAWSHPARTAGRGIAARQERLL